MRVTVEVGNFWGGRVGFLRGAGAHPLGGDLQPQVPEQKLQNAR
jgi:hypothetical protein